MDLNDKVVVVVDDERDTTKTKDVEMTVKEVCNKYKLDANQVLEYVNENDCTWEEAIVTFMPQWYINILGGIVITEE